MAFPADPIGLTWELKIGGVWTDITDDVRQRDGVKITRGRPDESAHSDPAKLTLSINNRSGKYSPRNPESPYYGQFGRNTPIRVPMQPASPGYLLTSSRSAYASTPDSASISITGDMDFALEMVLLDGALARSSLIASHAFGPDQVGWQLWLAGHSSGTTDPGHLFFRWSPDGTFGGATSVPSTVPVSFTVGEPIAFLVEFDVDNGSSGNDVRFYTSDSLDGPWVQLGSTVTTSGVASIFDSGVDLRVGGASGGSGIVAKTYRARLRDGIGGTTVASPDFRSEEGGTGPVTDAQGNTWSIVDTATIVDPSMRFYGEVAYWPQEWDKSEQDAWTAIEANGITRRLGQGADPIQSTLRRFMPSLSGLITYWPMEDENGATQLAAAAGDAGAIPLEGSVTAGSANVDDFPGSAPLPVVNAGGSWRATVPPFSLVDDRWGVGCAFRFTGATTLPDRDLLEVDVSGSDGVGRIVVRSTSSPGLAVDIEDLDGVQVGTQEFTGQQFEDIMIGQWVDLQLVMRDDPLNPGTEVEAYARVKQILISGTPQSDAVWTDAPATSKGRPARIGVGALGGDPRSWGHVYARTGTIDVTDNPFGGEAAIGFNDERAGDRIVRLCAENEVPVRLIGDRGDGTASMGPQRSPATFLDLIKDCARRDGGILTEPRDMLGLLYVTRTAMLNPPAPAVGTSYADGVMWKIKPVDDDRFTRNDVTVKRDHGSSARAILESGALSVQPPPDGVGRYKTTETINAATDGVLPHEASWRLSLGTVDEPRFPGLGFNMAASAIASDPALTAALRDLDVGQLLVVDDPPVWVTDSIRQMVQGTIEQFDDQFSWQIAVNCAPASPFDVGQYEAAEGAPTKFDTSGSVAGESSSAATTLPVATTAGPLWTTDDDEFPFDIAVGGERMTVTDIAAGGFEGFEGSITWSLGPGISSISQSSAFRHGGAFSLEVVPDGTQSTVWVDSDFGSAVPTSPGRVNSVRCWVLAASTSFAIGPDGIRAVLLWFDAGGSIIGTSPGAFATLPEGQEWYLYTATGTAPASTARVGVRVEGNEGSMDAGADDFYIDDVQIYQTFTVNRSINGVTKPHAQGTPVRLWPTHRLIYTPGGA